MDGVWTTYNEAAARLGVTPEAVRRRAIRNKWARMPGNDGKTRVMVPDELHPPRTPHVPPHVTSDTSALVSSLEAHIATLKTEIERLTAELAGERAGRQVDQEQAAARQADQEQQLAAARAAADRATGELVELARRLAQIAETQTSTEVAEAEPEPPRHWAIRAWRWMQKTA